MIKLAHTPPSINVFLHNKGRLLLSCLGRWLLYGYCQQNPESISFANNRAAAASDEQDEEIFTSAQL
jgi:hypothetical protein